MSTLYLLLGEQQMAFIEGARPEFLTEEQVLLERIRLGSQVDFVVCSIIPVEDGTVLDVDVQLNNKLLLSKVE